jgi:hypothetical protein
MASMNEQKIVDVHRCDHRVMGYRGRSNMQILERALFALVRSLDAKVLKPLIRG